MGTLAKKLVTDLFGQCGIAMDGPNPWDIHIRHPRFFNRVLTGGSLGFGESYMDGDWAAEQLDALFRRIIRMQITQSAIVTLNRIWHDLKPRLVNLQTRKGSLAIAETHYNLDHRLYQQFLGPYNQYTCCFFNQAKTLQEAEIEKLEMICNKLDLQPGDKVLDIGCGWGGFARYAAESRGCQVTGISIATEQITYARDFTAGLAVEIIESDYRDLPQLYAARHFDKIVIIGMLEHVGYRNYRRLFHIVNQMLSDHGLFLLHTIGNSTDTTVVDPWIEKYIFRNSMAPSMAQLAGAAEQLFVIQDWENYGHYYGATLAAWQKNFEDHWQEIQVIPTPRRFDGRFRRMFNYYFLSCKAGFETENILLWQLVISKRGRGRNVYGRVNLLS